MKRNEPDAEDIRLIHALKDERKRIRARIASMAGLPLTVDQARELATMRKELKHMTDRRIAEKFDLKHWVIKDV